MKNPVPTSFLILWLVGVPLLLVAPQKVVAFDSACEPIIRASEARIKAPAWQSTTNTGAVKLEAMKVNGQFYSRYNGGEWKTLPNIDNAEREMVAQMRSGQIKLSDCKNEGSETVDGVDTNVISYQIDMPGAPAARSKLKMGKSDNLPYAQTSTNMNVSYSYKNVMAPR